jgi:hypothetical protein
MIITPARPEDAFELQLRAEDASEVSSGWQQVCAASIGHHGGIVGRDALGRIVALGGVCIEEGTCVPWLLCSDLLSSHRAAVWRCAKRALRHHLLPAARSGLLVHNFIPKGSRGNRRFVQALGFRILPSPRDGFDFFYLPHV